MIGLEKSRGGRANRPFFPPDVVFPCRVSRHNALRCITSCYSFRYNKQLIAQLVGRHENLSHPENSCLPRASPSGDMNFQGGTNLPVSLQTGQLMFNVSIYIYDRIHVEKFTHSEKQRHLLIDHPTALLNSILKYEGCSEIIETPAVNKL